MDVLYENYINSNYSCSDDMRSTEEVNFTAEEDSTDTFETMKRLA